MKGKIIKGIAGFYYIDTKEYGIVECKAKGIFRNQNIKPLVGDNVEITILDKDKRKGTIIEVFDRENMLIRPAVANIDQAIITFAAKDPEPNFNLLDRFLISMLRQKVETIICFNKRDKIEEKIALFLRENYGMTGYKILFTSTYDKTGMEELKQLLQGKTTVLAGPSGVGKSSILNHILPDANMQIGAISEKVKRGKHTTRHSELFYVAEDTYLMDTPGFSSLYIDGIEKGQLKDYFTEFFPYQNQCRFQGCIHLNEPNCAVKEALKENRISKLRYHSYELLYEELKGQGRY